ncbi:ferredoxin [Streptomyces sp. DSM 15324]|uniref:Ferredoxin n=1 Tax=Streptomyces cinnabarigriseus TaxID=319633 RepID=F0V3Y6_9ACTN|nr:ferredoxin [Streptomyces sp. DSM 15324]KUO12361.1 ferredoxin [Streptomyces sp. DSM 15324]CBW54669.1 ferredoxin-2 [Streptomyces cinnabarigriseus]
MRIDIDKDRCLGSGQCRQYAPEVFDQDEDDALVTLLDAVPPQEFHDAVRDAAMLCPGAVITLHEG